MRTTLDIDEVLETAKRLARPWDPTAGAVVSEARSSDTQQRAAESAPDGVGGFVPFESRGDVVTHERIDRLREQDVD